jgi:hypothetical protein
VANFVIIPVLPFFITQALPLAPSILIGYAPGGPDPTDRGMLVMVVPASLVDLAVIFLNARIPPRRLARRTAAETESDLGNET